MKEWFADIDVQNVFSTRSVCNYDIIEDKMLAQMITSWKQEVHDKPILRTYVTFKSNFGVELYVVSYMSRSERCLLAQSRVGILPLRIETGRYCNLKLEERICELCNQETEDEAHFVCSCQTFEDL